MLRTHAYPCAQCRPCYPMHLDERALLLLLWASLLCCSLEAKRSDAIYRKDGSLINVIEFQDFVDAQQGHTAVVPSGVHTNAHTNMVPINVPSTASNAVLNGAARSTPAVQKNVTAKSQVGRVAWLDSEFVILACLCSAHISLTATSMLQAAQYLVPFLPLQHGAYSLYL